MSADVILDTIKGWKWFAFVPNEGREWLAARATLKPIAKGKTMYAPGMPIENIYGVVSGVFRIYMSSPKGEELTLEEVVAGGWFAHASPTRAPVYLTHCVCKQAASVVVIPHAVVTEFGERWPQFYKGLYQEFTDRGVIVLARLELLSLHNLNVRLAVYLLRLARLRGQREPDGSLWLSSDDSQSEVGTRVGGTRQRVNTALKTWSQYGLIETSKEGIRILREDLLKIEATRSGFDLDGYLAAWHGGWEGSK